MQLHSVGLHKPLHVAEVLAVRQVLVLGIDAVAHLEAAGIVDAVRCCEGIFVAHALYQTEGIYVIYMILAVLVGGQSHQLNADSVVEASLLTSSLKNVNFVIN